MGDTSIEWTNKSWNPIRARNLETGGVGHFCEKVSPGCANCYAARMQPRFKNHIRYNAADFDKVELFLDEGVLCEPLSWQKPCNIFVCSMTDLFADFVHDEDIRRILAVMMVARRHTFQILTKRPDRMREFFKANSPNDCYVEEVTEMRRANTFSRLTAELRTRDRFDKLPSEWPLPNVWLGTSVENQGYADGRIEDLLKVPAAVRWLSCEPLLEPINIYNYLDRPGLHDVTRRIDWVVVGGESGPRARPFDLSWARSLVGQCRVAGVPCFVKQLGKRPYDTGFDAALRSDPVVHIGARRAPHLQGFTTVHTPDGAMQSIRYMSLRDRKGGDINEFPEDLRVREFPGDAAKGRAG